MLPSSVPMASAAWGAMAVESSNVAKMASSEPAASITHIQADLDLRAFQTDPDR